MLYFLNQLLFTTTTIVQLYCTTIPLSYYYKRHIYIYIVTVGQRSLIEYKICLIQCSVRPDVGRIIHGGGLNSPGAGGILLCAVVEPLNHARISSVTPARIPSGGDSLSLSLPPPLSMENSLSFSLGSIERGPGKDVKRGRGNWLWSLHQHFF